MQRVSDPKEREDAYEILSVANGEGPLVLSCEHASVRLPSGYAWAPDDDWLVGTHWSYDIGAAELTADLCEVLGAPAVLSRFSRLLCDPNRGLDSPTLFRLSAEGRPVALNHRIDGAERIDRIERFYQPFHARLDEAVADRHGATVLSVHTFTPIYEGEARMVEVGVLFDREEALAARIAQSLGQAGLRARLNEPYSGRHGMMYSAQHHADNHGRKAVELEVRQDLAGSPAWRRRFAEILKRTLEDLLR